MLENKLEIVSSSFDLVNYTSCNAIQRAKEIIRYVHMWATKSVLLHKIGVESDFVFSTKPIIWTRVQDVNKSRYISHPAQYASLFFRVYSAWFMGWPVRHLFCMRGEIYCQNPRKNTRCFFLNGSSLNISRDCLSPKTNWDAWPLLGPMAPPWV